MSHRAEDLRARIAELMDTADEETLEEVVRILKGAKSARNLQGRWVGIESLAAYADATQLGTFEQPDVRGLWRYLCTTAETGLAVRRRAADAQKGFDERAWVIAIESLKQFALSLLERRARSELSSLPPLPSEQKTLLAGWAASL